MGRLWLHEREAVRALWRGHFEAWRLSGLTQREYCERHGLSLKSFGNWRGQLKREDVVGRDARWGRHPRLRHMVSPMATPMANEAADRVPAVVPRTGRRRQFSAEDKRLIVEETCRPGQSLSAVARRYGIDLRLLFRWRRALGFGGSAAPTTFVPVEVMDNPPVPLQTLDEPPGPATPTIIVERPVCGIEIELIGGRRVRFDRDIDAETMRRVVSALEGGGP
jgi:transposase